MNELDPALLDLEGKTVLVLGDEPTPWVAAIAPLAARVIAVGDVDTPGVELVADPFDLVLRPGALDLVVGSRPFAGLDDATAADLARRVRTWLKPGAILIAHDDGSIADRLGEAFEPVGERESLRLLRRVA